MTTIQELPRKLLDVACRVRVCETLYRDDELIDQAAHALKEALATRDVLARWIAEALPALEVADALEDFEDGGEHLRMLADRGKRLVDAVLGRPQQDAPNGPQCNLNTPWLAP